MRPIVEPIKIYESLKEKIFWLDLEPEVVLNLTVLSEEFGVSRTPVKEALIWLEADGWVLRHGSHFMVTPLSLDRIKEITEVRNVLEVQANIWAMSRISPKEMAELHELRREIKSFDDPSDKRHAVELDFRFHRILYHATRNGQLAAMLERLLGHYLRFWLSLPREIEPEPFFAEALEMIKLFENKDEDRLRAVTEAHIKNSVDEIMGKF